MVQTKKFENTFVNEYMAWNLHDRDVEKRAKAEGMREGLREGKREGLREGKREGIMEGKFNAYIDLIKSGLLSIKDAALKLGMSEADLQKRI